MTGKLKMTKEKNVFEVTFKCGNCWNEWTIEYLYGTRVQINSSNDTIRVKCPCCGSRVDVVVIDRTPIEE